MTGALTHDVPGQDTTSDGEWGPATSREEWLLMYQRGLSLRQISRLCRVKYEKVRLHIRTRERHDPTLAGRRLLLHDQPALPPKGWQQAPARPSWDDRYTELQELMKRTGRFPQQLSEDPAERRLYKWLRWQRTRHLHGRLTEDQTTRLDRLGKWQGTALGDRETHWRTIHAQLLAFIADAGRMPHRETPDATALEATLDVWIQTQRAKARAGKLAPTRRNTLDQTIPGWNTRASLRSG
ncbi:helicase associated domain-containing protein [Arthrobacter sp. D2-10]